MGTWNIMKLDEEGQAECSNLQDWTQKMVADGRP